jgi:hypothetical protein
MTERSTGTRLTGTGLSTRRTALAGLAALGIATTAGACSLVPGLGGDEEEPDDAAQADEDADGNAGSGEASDGGGEEPEQPDFEDWASEDQLDLVELDTAAADAEFGTMQGQFERRDRYGTWWSPGFPEDSPVFTAEPLRIDPAAEEMFGGRDVAAGAATGVLVQTAIEILDTPLLLEADNSRFDEVSPALVQAFGLEGFSPDAFDPAFEQVPVSGTADPAVGLPEQYGFEPRPYPAEGPRMSLLEANTEIQLMEGAELTGPLTLASARGALPVTTDEGEQLLIRSATFGLGLSQDGQNALCVYSVNAAPAVHIADPLALPVVAGSEVPEEWQEHTLGGLTAALPPEVGDADPSEVAVLFTAGERRASITRYLLSAPSPYPLTASRQVARVEVPGAELAVAAIGRGIDSTLTLGVQIHRGTEQYSVQLHHVTEDEAPLLAHQLLAGLNLAS